MTLDLAVTDVELWWTVKKGPPRVHHGARRGELARYVISHERRSGALMWIVSYNEGSLKLLELSACPDTLDDAKRVAREDIAYRIAGGQIPRKVGA